VDTSTHAFGLNGCIDIKRATFLPYGVRVERDSDGQISSSDVDLLGFLVGSSLHLGSRDNDDLMG
jgi:hypothetical protein